MSDGPHTEFELRRKGWCDLEREYTKNVRLARAVYASDPTAKRRAFLVRALSALETARAHIWALQT